MQTDLSVQQVTKTFGDFTAVDDVDFEVQQGQFFSILGPSGCGKTTLLRMIAGFTEPTRGAIMIREADMAGVSPNRRPVNLIFQHLALFPMMTVAQNIAFGLQRRGEKRSDIHGKVSRILERVDLPGFEDKTIDQLSGGQKQRVAIARCLVLEPAVLLLDEPLGALDLKLRKQMQVELKALQRQLGITFIYVTHDQDEALSMSDRLAVFREGQIEQIDTPSDIYETPSTRFVADFVGNANVLGQSLALALTGVPRACAIRPEKLFFAPVNAPRGENLVTAAGRVIDAHYHGATTRFTVEVGDGHRLIVIRPNDEKGRAAAVTPEKGCVIAWRREDAHYFTS
jgi:spermidine/putrescine transport system ATP-binding protein